ncbi:MAG: hypothetical protein ACRCS8_00615 [Brevinema sp.]
MKKAIFFLFFIIPICFVQIFSQNKKDGEVTNSSLINSELISSITNTYRPAYKTHNKKKLEYSKNFPRLDTDKSLLANIDKTFWQLKFTSNSEMRDFKTIQISFDDSRLKMSWINQDNEVVINNIYHLLPINIISVNEGYYIHGNPDGTQIFVYVKLIAPHLLVLKIENRFENIENSNQLPLKELPIFVII